MRLDKPEKDVPSKRVDPTKNQTTSFQSGVSCLAHEDKDPVDMHGFAPRMQPSRITESCIGQGFCERRTPTPDGGSSSRRSTPGQVVRTNLRPKDNLSAGCLTSDKCSEHPLNLPGKAGRAGEDGRKAAVGGSCHIFQGPNGFVPMGPGDLDMPVQAHARSASRDRPFQRACGVAAAMAG